MARKAPLQVARHEGTIRRRALVARVDHEEFMAGVEALIEEAALGVALFKVMDETGLRHVLEVHLRETQAAGDPVPYWLREAVLAFDTYASTAPAVRARGGYDTRGAVGDG